jgi:hypothetical protein
MSEATPRELFSVQIDPPRKAPQARCLIYSVYDNGVLTVLETDPYCQDNLFLAGHAFQFLSKEDLSDFILFAEEWAAKLKDCPYDLNLSDFQGSQFHLSLGGKMISGSYFLTDLRKAGTDRTVSKQALKIMEWDNRIVGFVQSFLQEHLQKLKGGLKPLPKDISLLDNLRPVSRYLAFLDKTDGHGYFLKAESKEEGVKAAAKKVFLGKDYPSGDVFNSCLTLIAQKALVILDASASRKDFDVAHSALTKEISKASLGSLTYVEAAYWLDLSYVYFLLGNGLITSETKASYLHVPAAVATLIADSQNATEESYLFFQRAGKEEWAPLRISPIYFFLESVFVEAHPAPEKARTHQA